MADAGDLLVSARSLNLVFALDPDTFERTTIFDGRQNGFYTWIRSKEQMLDSGAVVVTRPQQGRAFEVSGDGDIVFEIVNQKPDSETTNDVISEMRCLNWLLTALLVELALLLPIAAIVARLARSGGKAVHVVRTKAVSDHGKEKALAAYAQTTFVSSIKLAGLLLVLYGIAARVVAPEQLADGFRGFILGWRGIGFSIVAASVYLTLRNAIVRGRL